MEEIEGEPIGNDDAENAEINEEVLQIHPLLQRPVLDGIFHHLKDDIATLKTCRRVNSTWVNRIFETSIPLPIHIYNIGRNQSKNVHELLDVMSNPNSWLTCQDIRVSTVSFESLPIMSLVMDKGREIRRLKIDNCVNFLSLLILMEECPHLRDLDMSLTCRDVLLVPTRFQKTWENPLPCLKTLTFSRNIPQLVYGVSDCQVDIILHLWKTIKTLQTLALNNERIELWQRISAKLGQEQEPELFQQRLKAVHLNFYQLQCQRQSNILPSDVYHSIWNPKLPIKILSIKHIVYDITSDQLATILENITDTLEEFNIDDQQRYLLDEGPYGLRCNTNLTVRFRKEMVALKKIEIHHGSRIPLAVSVNDISVLEFLPRLNSLNAKTIISKVGQVAHETQWNKLFPVSIVGFTHASLTELEVDWLIMNYDTIIKIKETLPELTRLGVVVAGKFMQGFVASLTDSKIKELDINCIASETAAKGLNELSSAIIGASKEDCGAYEITGKVPVKVLPSLQDWECLRKLTIGYDRSPALMQDASFLRMNKACALGLGKIVQLKEIVLKKLEILPGHISEILGKVPLTNVDLSQCKINHGDDANALTIHQVRAQFPGVRLIY